MHGGSRVDQSDAVDVRSLSSYLNTHTYIEFFVFFSLSVQVSKFVCCSVENLKCEHSIFTE